jgi:hypothetical protein
VSVPSVSTSLPPDAVILSDASSAPIHSRDSSSAAQDVASSAAAPAPPSSASPEDPVPGTTSTHAVDPPASRGSEPAVGSLVPAQDRAAPAPSATATAPAATAATALCLFSILLSLSART